MCHIGIILTTLTAIIGSLQADCVLDTDPPMKVPENSYTCEPVQPGSNNTQNSFGSRFLFCLKSELQLYECEAGLKFDIVLKECTQGPPRCSLQATTTSTPGQEIKAVANTTNTQLTPSQTVPPVTVLQATTTQTATQNLTRTTPVAPTQTTKPAAEMTTQTTTQAMKATPTTQPTKPAAQMTTQTTQSTTQATQKTTPPQNLTPPLTSTPTQTTTQTLQTTTQTTTQTSTTKDSTTPIVTTHSLQSIIMANQPPTTGCSWETCKLPNCSCIGAVPKIDIKQAPMMLMMGFDDAVTQAFMGTFYQDLLVDDKFSLRNPNKCPVKATFFLSGANTDFRVVKALYDAGHEFASHTIHHILPDGGTQEEYTDEIVGMRNLLVNNSHVIPELVRGFRAPYLKLAGNMMFQVLLNNRFLYDASISNIERKKGNSHLWPFTMDYPIPLSMCPNGPCPDHSFPNLWQIPLNSHLTVDGGYCAMIDACIVANMTDDPEVVREKYLQYFQDNFYNDFYPNKVPMHLFTHTAVFLRSNGSYPAFIEFLQEVLKRPDVWVLTPSQVIDYMKNPVTNSEAIEGAIPSWKC